jgi:hypothetical protein
VGGERPSAPSGVSAALSPRTHPVSRRLRPAPNRTPRAMTRRRGAAAGAAAAAARARAERAERRRTRSSGRGCADSRGYIPPPSHPSSHTHARLGQSVISALPFRRPVAERTPAGTRRRGARRTRPGRDRLLYRTAAMPAVPNTWPPLPGTYEHRVVRVLEYRVIIDRGVIVLACSA